jgi:heme A synthase
VRERKLKPTRIIANAVGGILFVQVILGGLSVVFNVLPIYHVIWGVVTFIVLVVGTVFAVRDYGRGSTIFKIAIAAIVDYIVQGILGFFSFSNAAVIVVHLANAFVLAVLATSLAMLTVPKQSRGLQAQQLLQCRLDSHDDDNSVYHADAQWKMNWYSRFSIDDVLC